mmetsp:Transcript_26630/g.74434  ORF Transcript_26630/g.74434 Transcript_26630/m.74434 type:complete len:313 (-) Transcript_26630:204-1142(-)|eukprot:CAMPEP_0119148740 /NCGR_PEP_ID=MMETSP1310-20130426/42288_1 /TAXON_ID=464262 /ORGANISM="Genus nov. species nov., Strain RCC2339" /LENGTH=312 /DNA_ID=CAMNT_0007140791 /DNA_START=34 /DNA_END=972 /DNA_ORIENTATION=+
MKWPGGANGKKVLVVVAGVLGLVICLWLLTRVGGTTNAEGTGLEYAEAMGRATGNVATRDEGAVSRPNLLAKAFRESQECAAKSRVRDVVRCPCCGWCGAETDLIVRGNLGRHVACPVCGTYGRHRDSCERLGGNPALLSPRELHSHRPFRLLHFGPQKQMEHVLASVPDVDQFLVDKLAKGYRYNPDTLEVDITDLRFPTGFADGAILLHVLEHISEFDTALAEVGRVLRHGSWLLVSVPCEPSSNAVTRDCRGLQSNKERIDCARQWDHVWWFACKDFIARVERAGFRCPASEYNSVVHQSMCYRLPHHD